MEGHSFLENYLDFTISTMKKFNGSLDELAINGTDEEIKTLKHITKEIDERCQDSLSEIATISQLFDDLSNELEKIYTGYGM